MRNFLHKLCEMELSEDKKYLYSTYCCSTIMKYEIESKAIIKKADFDELTSFTSLKVLKDYILLLIPNRLLKLDLDLNIIGEYKDLESSLKHRKKNKFGDKLKISKCQKYISVRKGKRLLIFESNSFNLIYVHDFKNKIVIFSEFFGNNLIISTEKNTEIINFLEKKLKLKEEEEETSFFFIEYLDILYKFNPIRLFSFSKNNKYFLISSENKTIVYKGNKKILDLPLCVSFIHFREDLDILIFGTKENVFFLCYLNINVIKKILENFSSDKKKIKILSSLDFKHFYISDYSMRIIENKNELITKNNFKSFFHNEYFFNTEKMIVKNMINSGIIDSKNISKVIEDPSIKIEDRICSLFFEKKTKSEKLLNFLKQLL